ncbi:exodeoxyribonuclease X C-terminal domain-containing protein [Aquirufa lenticrescens]|uniref:exodeoxyribonuclease X C-terminal domain-containing protein n=1 Tax=Aquirufa lenticrescens TaxID=2696560 RepID=UPI001CAA49EE|nr:hypothetical protein [Aquirufa lenticrescens]UAJ14343.1 hypothetical protein G9X62_07130 [Aquirufa lenticrescens]
MKNYELNSIFTFGKYKGSSLQQVYGQNPSYIEWCILNLEHFNIEEDVFYELQSLNSSYQFSDDSLNKLQSNWQAELDEVDFDDYEEPDYDPYSDWERDSFDALTDGQCGSYDDFNENGGDWDTMMAGMGH